MRADSSFISPAASSRLAASPRPPHATPLTPHPSAAPPPSAGDLQINSEGLGKGCTVVATMRLPAVPPDLVPPSRFLLSSFSGGSRPSSASDTGDGTVVSSRGVEVGIRRNSSYAKGLLQIRGTVSSTHHRVFPQPGSDDDGADGEKASSGDGAKGENSGSGISDPELGMMPTSSSGGSSSAAAAERENRGKAPMRDLEQGRSGDSAMLKDIRGQGAQLVMKGSANEAGGSGAGADLIPGGGGGGSGTEASTSSFSSTAAAKGDKTDSLKQTRAGGPAAAAAPASPPPAALTSGAAAAARARRGGGVAGVVESDPRLSIVRVLAAEDDPMMRCASRSVCGGVHPCLWETRRFLNRPTLINTTNRIEMPRTTLC